MAYNPQIFRIGLTMAGAISAGAYTAGVMDFLLETLNKWNKAKQDKDDLAPPHQVIIDAIGGASAGGISVALGGLALFNDIEPVLTKTTTTTGNLLYDSWVIMADEKEKSTFEKMLTNDDLQSNSLVSLLNSNCIDEISDRALKHQIKSLPAYISQNLHLIITLSSLREIPLKIDFQINKDLRLKNTPETPAHKMSFHKLVAHFKFKKEQGDGDHLLPFDPTNIEDKKLLIKCAKATSAFPVGLKSRHFNEPQFTKKYVGASTKRLLDRSGNAGIDMTTLGNLSEIFSFTAVDGGMLNNEPFGEVSKVLEEKYQASIKSLATPPLQKNYGIIMIDPFPNFNFSQYQKDHKTTDVLQVIPSLISALRGQSMVKENELMDIISGDYPRAMVFPTRYKNGKKVDASKAIASSVLGGFGGFINQDFRAHDFFLGRENCKNFLQTFFSFKESDNHPIHQNWTDEMKSIFGIYIQNEKYLPIIPNMENAYNHRKNINRTSQDRKQHQINYDTIKISPKEIISHKEKITERVKAIINKLEFKKSENSDPEIDKIVDELYQKNMFQRFGSWLSSPIKDKAFSNVKNTVIPDEITKIILKIILSDLKKHGLLKK